MNRDEAIEASLKDQRADLLRALKKSLTLEQVAAKLGVSIHHAIDTLLKLKEDGFNVHQYGDVWILDSTPSPQRVRGELPVYESRPDGTCIFGFTSDNHLGSKYERLDVLNGLYDHFARIGVDRVFNAGNWIDGEARFNKHDLHVHGMQRQLEYLAKHYPQRPGITTYAVAGDDHEGWYCQQVGVDIGWAAEQAMRKADRTDWVDLGYMEAFVTLRHAVTGKETKLLVIHPGGGSSYAISYTVQKIAEAFDGGEKPGCALVGHYHKMSYNLVRNVHMIQTGCTEDQTPFMRKKRLAAHVGGGVCRLTLDPHTGAITACAVEFFPYFVRGYYNDRWSMSDAAILPERSL
jgi:hypothetical protein